MKIFSRNKIFYVYFWSFVLLFAIVFAFLTVPQSDNSAYADLGPKPSVVINFENMSDELCYGTLLSQQPSTGPSSVWDGVLGQENVDDDSRNIWQAFVDYTDADGYYYLQVTWKCSETKDIKWLYYPPSPFKILLYYPESDSFVVSGIYEKYAFNSYYKVNMEGINISDIEQTPLPVEKSYNFAKEIPSFILRVIITILIEIVIALLFRFKQKHLLSIIIITNTVTQILLNVGLNLIRFYQGQWMMYAYYVLFEVIVFAIEAVVYSLAFRRVATQKIPIWKIVLYAFLANLTSFGAGFGIIYIAGIM